MLASVSPRRPSSPPVPPRALLAVFCVVLVAACGESRADSAAEASTDAASDAPRRILVTNDDGIEHPPTVTLARALASDDEVFLVAPDSIREVSP